MTDCFTLPIATHDTTHWLQKIYIHAYQPISARNHITIITDAEIALDTIFLLHVKKNLDYSLLGCNALLFEVPTFQRTYSLHLEDRFFYPEDEGDRFLQNAGTLTPKLRTTSCPRTHTHYYQDRKSYKSNSLIQKIKEQWQLQQGYC
jgi:hypothetical protein